VKLPKDSRLAN